MIKQPLADEVLFGKLKKGGSVKVTVETKEDGKTGLKLECIPDENATRKERPLSASGGEGSEGGGDGEAACPSEKAEGRRLASVPRVPLKA